MGISKYAVERTFLGMLRRIVAKVSKTGHCVSKVFRYKPKWLNIFLLWTFSLAVTYITLGKKSEANLVNLLCQIMISGNSGKDKY